MWKFKEKWNGSWLLALCFLGIFFLSITFAPKFQAAYVAISKLAHTSEHPNKNKPIIGILLNSGQVGDYSRYPSYALRKNYSQIITQYGGVPIFIGHDSPVLEEYLKLIDGILLTGGEVELPEQAFTTGINFVLDPAKFPRAHFEYPLIHQAYARNIPVLGICAGMQNMNVALGGTLIQNIQQFLYSSIVHQQEDREQVQHFIQIFAPTQLNRIIGVTELGVNSNHRAGLGKVSPHLRISAKAPDGAIEGVEADNKRFFIGVMWHPEFMLSEQEEALWQAFIQAAKDFQEEKNHS